MCLLSPELCPTCVTITILYKFNKYPSNNSLSLLLYRSQGSLCLSPAYETLKRPKDKSEEPMNETESGWVVFKVKLKKEEDGWNWNIATTYGPPSQFPPICLAYFRRACGHHGTYRIPAVTEGTPRQVQVHHRDTCRQTLTPGSVIVLACVFLVCGRKPTCARGEHTKRPRGKPVTFWPASPWRPLIKINLFCLEKLINSWSEVL